MTPTPLQQHVRPLHTAGFCQGVGDRVLFGLTALDNSHAHVLLTRLQLPGRLQQLLLLLFGQPAGLSCFFQLCFFCVCFR